MNNLLKNSLYSFIGSFFVVQIGIQQVLANSTTPGSTFGINNASTTANKLENEDLGLAIQNYVNYIMTFLYLIAVMYALWGGFNILTAGGEEDKVKKGKTILIQGGTGLLVIFLAGTIVKWILSMLAA